MQNAQWWDMLYQLVRNCYRAAAARERFPIDVQQAEFERTSREARGHRLTTRRRWVGTTILAAAAGGVGCFVDTVGRPIGTVPFEGEGRSPLDTLTGDELDGRQFTDLSGLDSGHLVTPTARFYIRTRASHPVSYTHLDPQSAAPRLGGTGREESRPSSLKAAPHRACHLSFLPCVP